MAEPRQCEFMLLRYLPDVVSEEAVNFGVVLVEKGWPEKGEAHVRLLSEREWERLERVAEVDVLRSIGEALAADFAEGTLTREGERVRGELLRKYEDWFSGNVQLGERRGVLAEAPAEEIEALARMYLERRVERSERRTGSRAQIAERMREEFRVWNVLGAPGFREGIRASEWAAVKREVRIDFGYATRDGREFKMYQAVDTGSEVEALRLANVWPKLRAGVRAKAQREARLTAVIAGRGEGEFAVEVMEEAGIGVALVSEAESLARVAAEELL